MNILKRNIRRSGFEPLNIQDDFNELENNIAAALEKGKLERNSLGLVLYTDGGCRPPPRGIGGWGVHGYFYLPIVPKVGHGCKGFMPTAAGYVNYEASDKPESDEVTVITYVDSCGAITPASTNNEAELYALREALQLALKVLPGKLFMRMDSEYALYGLTESLPKWKANGWRRSDGSPASNITVWKELDVLYQEVCSKIEVRMEWVKGHSDSVGNGRADYLATSGVFAGHNGYDHRRQSFTDIKGYWAPKRESHKLLSESHWYFDTLYDAPTKIGDLYVYHMGDHGGEDNDDECGKPGSDKSYCVVAITEPDPILEKIRQYQISAASDAQMSFPVMARLRNITNSKLYTDLAKYGCLYLARERQGPELSTPAGVVITKEGSPPRQLYEAMAVLENLEARLAAVINDKVPSSYGLTEITQLIYEQELVKDTPVLKVKLQQSDLTSLSLPVNYKFRGEEKTAKIVMTFGIDIPRRNLFLGLVDAKPKVYVLTWPEPCSAEAFRYATVVVTEKEAGIWEGAHSNLRIVS